MAVIQLNTPFPDNSGSHEGSSSPSSSSNQSPNTTTLKSASTRSSTPTALHEGGILLSGSRAVDLQAAERFRILRARIERLNLTGTGRHVLAVTSAVPEEGKSLIAANMARALAMDSRGKTLLIDCDLRKPTMHRYFGVPFSPGLSDALVGNRSLASVVQSVEPGLDIIPAGSPVVDATRAVELPQLALMLDELKKHYRYVIVDCPPVLLCPEPLILSSLVEGTVMVVRAWKTHRRLVKEAVNLLGKDKFLGIIVNDANDTLNEYGYYGYYGYNNRGPKNQNPHKGSAEQTATKLSQWGKEAIDIASKAGRSVGNSNFVQTNFKNPQVAAQSAARGLSVVTSKVLQLFPKKAVLPKI